MKLIVPASAMLALAAALCPLAAARAQALPGDTVVVQWNEVTVQSIAATKPPPTAAARELAIVATAMYDAWAAFNDVSVPTQPGNGVGRAPATLRTPAAIASALSYAAYAAEVNLFPSQMALATAQMAALGLDPADASTDPTTPAGIGNLAAAAVIAFRRTDGSNQDGSLSASGKPYSDYSGYSTPNTPTAIVDPNQWQPLSVPNAAGMFSTQTFATPFWGAVTPFATLPPFWGRGPARYPDWRYTFDSDLLLSYSARLNDTTKTIADYWADPAGTQLPPGHWSRIGEFVSRRDQHSQDDDVKLFFALNNALLDAGIECWGVKRAFNSERPITSIHYLFTGRPVFAWQGYGLGSGIIDGGAWLPYQERTVVTPPFAEYISGHSTFSAAAATVLENFTGSDRFGLSVTIAPGSSSIEPGIVPSQPVTLDFPTFSAAAAQAGLSRRYGGIHFPEGDLDGRFTGRVVGQLDWWQAQSYITGRSIAPPDSRGPWAENRYGVQWGAQPGPGWGIGWGGWGGDWGDY
jgi:hypothetical protein